jgi:hypothetical protein
MEVIFFCAAIFLAMKFLLAEPKLNRPPANSFNYTNKRAASKGSRQVRPQTSGKSDFRYPENPNPEEFLVYLVASEDLGALKIGVGTSGRVLQLLNSTVRSQNGLENVGWKVLRTAAFSGDYSNFESGRAAAYEAERRVLHYWRKYLNAPTKVANRDMGWAEMIYKGTKGFHRTKGYTETVDIHSVCESSTWNIVVSSPGYLGNGSSFSSSRSLTKNVEHSISQSTAPGYSIYKRELTKNSVTGDSIRPKSSTASTNDPAERTSYRRIDSVPKTPSIRKNKKMPKSDGTKEGKFWSRVEKDVSGCWHWHGSISTESGYAQMLWEGRPQLAHRIAWQLTHGELPVGDTLMNKCGERTCVSPEHWELRRSEERECLTPDCTEPSIKKMVDGYCSSCERRRRYEYRKTRPNPYMCTNPACRNPSGTVAFASLCHSCRRKGVDLK